MTKVEEEIQSHKQHKKFLDLIAIASKNKILVNQKERNRIKKLREQQYGGDLEDGSGDEQRQQRYNPG